MMKMNSRKGCLNKIILIGIVLNMLLSLAGCKLAKEEAESLIINDKLVGCYITTEPIGNSKIYANLVEVKEEYAEYSHFEYRFEGYEGIGMYATTIINRKDGDDYDIASYGEELCNRKSISSYDCEEIEGTLYYTGTDVYFYMNPVYQEKDGDVYMVECNMAGHTNGNGQMSQTLTGKAAYNVGTDSVSQYSKVTVTYVPKQEPDKIRFIYMDEDSKILQEDEYEPGEVPEELTVLTGTEYILVESYGYDAGEEMDTVERKTYSELDGYISTFVADGKGHCVEKSTFVKWE